MWINSAGQLYIGDCQVGDREGTVDEIAIIRMGTSQQQRDAIQAQIDGMEHQQILPRITRESLLLIMVSTAASMGLTEPQFYAANIGYHRLKDFDAAIIALRAQMAAIV